MGRPKGHPGPVKPDEEKLDKPFRIGFTSNERELVKKDAAKLNISVSKFFRTLWVEYHSRNA